MKKNTLFAFYCGIEHHVMSLVTGNKISRSKLPVTGSLIDDLKECIRFGDCLERFELFTNSIHQYYLFFYKCALVFVSMHSLMFSQLWLIACSLYRGCFVFRFSVFQMKTGSGPDEVVPSSNPASQSSIGDSEALWHLEKIESRENTSPWEESFTPCKLEAPRFSFYGGN